MSVNLHGDEELHKLDQSDEDPISPEELDAYNAWRHKQGLPVVPIKHPKNQHGVSVSDPAWLGLDKLAQEFGFTHARSGNISELLEAIGQGVLKVSEPNN